MVCDTLVYHPTVSRTISYLEKTGGREKVLRLLQYLSNFLALQKGSLLFRNLQVQVTLVRKFLRFAKSISFLQLASKAYDNQLSTDRVGYYCNILKNLSNAGYMLFDNINLLKMLAILPKNRFTQIQVPKYSNYFWLFAILPSLLTTLKSINLQLLKIKALKDESNEFDVNTIKDCYQKNYQLFKKLVIDLLDAFIVLNNLNYLNYNKSYVALAGVITSVTGIQDIWKTS